MIRPQKTPTVGVSTKVLREEVAVHNVDNKHDQPEETPTNNNNIKNNVDDDVNNTSHGHNDRNECRNHSNNGNKHNYDINTNDDQDTTNGGTTTGTTEEEDEERQQLYKSPRLKGYLTIMLSSIINFHGVLVSQDKSTNNDAEDSVITSTEVQRYYGYTVALVSSCVAGFCVICHLDTYSCLANTWKNKLFAPKAKFETLLDGMLVLWWFMAVIIQTRFAGIAGDGKQQYNIYFSTWCCFLCGILTLESKMTEHNWPSIRDFIQSWPHRAPGWIAILISDFVVLFWYVDVYREYSSGFDETGSESSPMQFYAYYQDIPNIQYELLMFVAAATLLPSAGFVFMEIFRESSDDKKDTLETLLELISLLVLACAWIPTVCIATTPGGFAMNIGNSWFFTWSTCFLVMETLLWFFSDSRGGIHQTLIQREEEYHQHQLNVLSNTKAMHDENIEQRKKDDSDIDRDDNDHEKNDREYDDSDDISLSIRIEDPPPIKSRKSAEDSIVFEMKDDCGNEENLNEIHREIQLKETDKHAYFDTLNDILG